MRFWNSSQITWKKNGSTGLGFKDGNIIIFLNKKVCWRVLGKFTLCAWSHPHTRSSASSLKEPPQQWNDGRPGVVGSEDNGMLSVIHQHTPLFMLQLCFKFLSTRVRTIGNPLSGMQHSYRERERWAESPSSSGCKCGSGLVHPLLPPFPSMSQFPVYSFQEFLLSQSQQHIEISRIRTEGDGRASIRPQAEQSAAPRLPGFLISQRSRPPTLHYSQWAGSIDAHGRAMRGVTDGFKTSYCSKHVGTSGTGLI